MSTPRLLDTDVTIKPLYGRQEGAEYGYNPTKPGRPSRAYHSYWMARLRLCLDVEGDQATSMASTTGWPPGSTPGHGRSGRCSYAAIVVIGKSRSWRAARIATSATFFSSAAPRTPTRCWRG